MRILVLEHDEKFINTLPYGLARLNHEVFVSGQLSPTKIEHIHSCFSPDFVLLLGWSSIHEGEQLKHLMTCRDLFKVPFVYWATEDPTFYEDFSLNLVQLLNIDYVFTVSRACVSRYKEKGFLCHHLEFGYSPLLSSSHHYPINQRYPISLVANGYPNVLHHLPHHKRQDSMNTLLSPLLEEHYELHFFGKDWEYTLDQYIDSKHTSYLHSPIGYLKLGDIYNRSLINLCLQNYTEDVLSMRTFDIMGSGNLALSSAHNTLNEYFDVDKTLCVSHDPDETKELASYLLQHPDHIKKRGLASQEAILSHHTYVYRGSLLLQHLQCSLL